MTITETTTPAAALTEPAYITQAKAVLNDGFFCDLNEEAPTPIDATTAGLMVQVWGLLSADKQAKLVVATHVDLLRYVDFCWKAVR